MFGHQRGSSIVSQCRYDLSRHWSSQSGSCFLAEMRRTTSSLRPRGTVSLSISVTKPHLYSWFASFSMVSVAVLMVNSLSCRERKAATSARNILTVTNSLIQHSERHQRLRVVEDRRRQAGSQ